MAKTKFTGLANTNNRLTTYRDLNAADKKLFKANLNSGLVHNFSIKGNKRLIMDCTVISAFSWGDSPEGHHYWDKRSRIVK